MKPMSCKINNQGGVDLTKLSFMIKSKLGEANEGVKDSSVVRRQN